MPVYIATALRAAVTATHICFAKCVRGRDLAPYTVTTILLCKIVVGLSGLEPPTSRLSGVRSNRLSYKPILSGFRFALAPPPSSLSILRFRRFSQAFGGDKRDRTADPLLAKQVLSQLSYTPVYLSRTLKIKQRFQNIPS